MTQANESDLHASLFAGDSEKRCLRTLRDLAARTREAKTAAAACTIALETLAHSPADIPFALLYRIDAASHRADLAGTMGIEPRTPASPESVDLQAETGDQPWPLASALASASPQVITAGVDRWGALNGGPWPESPHTALVLPMTSPGQERPTGLMVVGISPRRVLDDDYQGFLELVAGQVAAAIAHAQAHETKQQRAASLPALNQAKPLFCNSASPEFRLPPILMHDISDRQQAELALQEREEILNLLISYAPIEIAMFDPQMRYLMASQRWIEDYGLESMAAVLGRSHYDIFPEISERWKQVHQQCLAGATRRCEADRFERLDGSIQWLRWEVRPWYRANQTIGGIVIFSEDITERKQIEADLQIQHRQLQQQLAEIETLYQSAPIGLNVLDQDLRFVRINQRLAEMNGFSVDEHIGRTVRELLPDLADAAEQVLRPILETGEPLLNVELTGATPAQPGIQRTWVESFLPLKDGDRVIGISTVCEEVTDRKRIEAERQQALAALQQAKDELEQRVAERTAELRQINTDLRQSESILRSFFDSAVVPMGIVELHDDDVLHISDNWAAAQFMGFTPAAMAHRFTSELGTSDDTIQRWIAYYQAAAQTQTPMRFEYCQERGEQGVRWLAGSVCPIAVSPGEYPRFSYILEDITERKQAEATIARSEEQLRLSLEFTHIGTWDWDVVSGLTTWNDNHFKLLGLTPNPDDNLYQRWCEAIHPEDRERVEQALLGALHNHTDYEAEYRIIRPDGSLRWLIGKGRGMYNADQEPIRMLGVIIDVSDRKEFQDKIQASLKEKELLLKEIYHRVKNNLQVIYSLLNLQSRNLTDAAALSVLKDSQSRVRAMALVHEKLYKSRDLTRIDLADYIKSLAYSLLDTYRSPDSTISLTLAIQPCQLDIETALPCGLMLTELISNALKYAFPDGGAGEITIALSLPTPDQACLVVQDNGVGLPADFNLQTVSSLGLNLVRNLARQIKGEIAIAPQSVGSAFQISFPL